MQINVNPMVWILLYLVVSSERLIDRPGGISYLYYVWYLWLCFSFHRTEATMFCSMYIKVKYINKVKYMKVDLHRSFVDNSL